MRKMIVLEMCAVCVCVYVCGFAARQWARVYLSGIFCVCVRARDEIEIDDAFFVFAKLNVCVVCVYT